MTAVADATSSQPESVDPVAGQLEPWKVVTPYLIAIGSQLPMLYLYYRNLVAQPHYQPFAIAIVATIAIALMRWPFGSARPFRHSVAADVLIVLGLGAAALGVLFVEPWFAALAAMLFTTSLFARTNDRELPGATLWPCALPLFVYLSLPNGLDVRLITTLQGYSAQYTSRLLDVVGLGHYMDGTVINVPNLQEYGIEQACSGVQSFFTLSFVAVVFIVLSRRIRVPALGVSGLALMLAGTLLVFRLTPNLSVVVDQLLILGVFGLVVFSFLGLRAALLILSAVFWAVFMNTIRILTIPLSEYLAGIDLSTGISHDILGYTALTLGILMLLSTDQFLMFLFGPVEDAESSGPFGGWLGNMWNGLSPSEATASDQRTDMETVLSPSRQRGLWGFAILMVIAGLWQLVDVQRSLASAEDIRFFDDDMTVEFTESDLPQAIGSWERTQYLTEDRSRGSDLGERSDMWQYQSRQFPAVLIASLDQTFPGWHELTTCYRNLGWQVRTGNRRVLTPRQALAGEDDQAVAASMESSPDQIENNDWDLVEVELEKPTGEQGYLLFSHFDSFGEGLEAPVRWGTLNSFFIRASNRLSHRIRARLLRGEAYQFQVLLTSWNELTPEMKREARQAFLELREQARSEFLARQSDATGT